MRVAEGGQAEAVVVIAVGSLPEPAPAPTVLQRDLEEQISQREGEEPIAALALERAGSLVDAVEVVMAVAVIPLVAVELHAHQIDIIAGIVSRILDLQLVELHLSPPGAIAEVPLVAAALAIKEPVALVRAMLALKSGRMAGRRRRLVRARVGVSGRDRERTGSDGKSESSTGGADGTAEGGDGDHRRFLSVYIKPRQLRGKSS